MATKKKIDVLSIVICAVLLVATVVSIVGVCIAWISSTGSVTGTSYPSETISDLLEASDALVSAGGNAISGLNANAAFAIMAVIFCGLTLVGYLLSKLFDIKVMKFIVLALAILAIVCAVVTLITAYTVAGDEVYYLGRDAKPAAGVWLVTIFGVIGGCAGAFAAIKK